MIATLLLGLTACGLLPDNNAASPKGTPTVESPTQPTGDMATAAIEPTAEIIDEETGVINGRIWHDVCANDGDPADGCITTAAGDYQGNGRADDEESGITDILVQLGDGPCPTISTDNGSVLGINENISNATTTDEQGDFLFAGLSAGDYCLMINTLSEPNRDILLPGVWTTPHPGLQTISLNPGETINLDFGWDYDFLPVTAASLNCRDEAEFVEDVTIPDDTIIPGGEVFTKTWRLRNVGTCDWTPAYALTFVEGYELDGPQLVPLTTTITPTDTVDFSVVLTAPTITGTFRADWLLYNANQRESFGIFGDEPIWVQIVVEDVPEETAVTPTPEAETDNE
jgi:hypothetical protein